MDFYIFSLSLSISVFPQYLHLCHVSQHGENDEPRHEAGDTVDGAGDDGVLVAVVVELVVAGQGQQGAKAGPEGEEDLSGGGNPDLSVS